MTDPLVQPIDAADRALLSHVRPPRWSNPDPHQVYDLVVLGGGTAGLVCAVGAAGLGARVALVERRLLGGDCLNTGCVPSKSLLRSARAAAEARAARDLGVAVGGTQVDFAVVMQRLRERRAVIGMHDSAGRLAELGVHVFFGDAAFADDRIVTVGHQRLCFRRAVIATGGRPAVPNVHGLRTIPYLTNESVFSLRERPRHLLVIGAGPIGCEMSQAFARCGSEVTLFDAAPRALPRDDVGASVIVQRALVRDGVHLVLGAQLLDTFAVDGAITVAAERPGEPIRMITGDQLLVAVGRTPNTEGLNLASGGIAVDAGGIRVDDRLRTTNPRVYASGDVCSAFRFTHAADAMSRIVIQNALFFGRRRASALVIPWCTYTSPEVAHVGWDEQTAPGSRAVQAITVDLREIDRAVIDDEAEGFLRVYHEKGRLVGCTIVAPHAGELIGQASYAMTRGARLSHFSNVVYPYPTVGEAFRKAGDRYRRSRLSARTRRWLERYFAWTR